MKCSGYKNNLRAGMKPLERFAGLMKQDFLTLKFEVSEDGVRVITNYQDCQLQSHLVGFEAQELGSSTVLAFEFIEAIKSIKKNTLLSIRRTEQGLIIATPVGEVVTVPIVPEGMPISLTQESERMILSLSMDEFLESAVQVGRIIPKKHVFDVFCKIKWQVSQHQVSWLSASSSSLAVKRFKPSIVNQPQLFYLEGSLFDLLKRCLGETKEQQWLFSTTVTHLFVSGEQFQMAIPLLREDDVPLEALVSFKHTVRHFSSEEWINQIDQKMEELKAQNSTLTLKQVFVQVKIEESGCSLDFEWNEKTNGIILNASELYKLLSSIRNDAWECLVPINQSKVIGFRICSSQSVFEHYLLMMGLI